MGDRLKTLGVRSLSGALFAVVLLGGIWWNYITFSILFFIIALGCLYEFYKLSPGSPVSKGQRLAGYMSAGAAYLLFTATEQYAPGDASGSMLLMCAIPVIVLGAAVFDTDPDAVRSALYSLAGLVYCVLPFGLLHLIPQPPAAWQPYDVIAVILLIWTNDTFAYVWGQLLGRRKLVERISPGKTVEGTLGGLLTTFAVSFLIRDHVASQPGDRWLLLGALVPVVATLGDLFESMLKRKAGVKDSGAIMPGHGGFLDRFDSLLFVSPFVVAVFSLLELN